MAAPAQAGTLRSEEISEQASTVTHSRYIPALDGLRAIAVLAVVLYHMVPGVLPSGLLGVTLFFVLSGYLITGLLIREWRETSTIDLPRFWMHRIRRLLPAIVFCLLTVAVLTGLLAPDLLTKLRRDLLAALFWFTNWWYIFLDQSYFEAAGAPSPVTHFWSLAIEEQFYLVWPPILLLLFRNKVRKRMIQRCVLGLAAASVLLMVILYDPAADPTRVYYGTDTRAFSLLIGVWLAFAFPEKRLRGLGRKGLTPQARRLVGRAGLVALAGIIVCMVLVNTYSPFLYYGGLLLVSVLTALVIMALVNPKNLISRWLSVWPMVWLGKISYGIYIWHFPLLLLMNDYNSASETFPLLYLVQMLVIVAVASVSYALVEQPIRRGCLGRMWHSVHDGLTTWGAVLRKHVVQLVLAAALLGGGAYFLITVPDTATQQHQAQETDVEAIVPEGAMDGSSAEGEGAESEQPQQPEEIVVRMTREEMLAQLGANPALAALSDETLQQLVDTPGDSPQEKARNTQFIMVGDSVSAAFSEQVYGGFSEMFPKAILDADYNRRIAAGIDIFKGYLDQGWNGPVVVFELSTNGTNTIDELNEMLSAVPEGKMVFVANTRSGSAATLQDENNKHIYTLAANNPNVEVLDWYANSMGHDEYFDGDGTHLTPQTGRNAYLNMLLANLETLYR